MINIVNLSKDFMFYLDYMEKTNIDARSCWLDICYSKHPDVYDHVEELYKHINVSTELHNAVFKYFTKEELSRKIASISERLYTSLETLIRTFKENGMDTLDELTFDVYVLVGNASTNAIVTPFNQGSLFLFLELLPEGEYFDMLLAHELFHVIQRQSISGQYDDALLVDLLFSEGIACAASKMVKPGYDPSAYIECRHVNESPERWRFIKENRNMILNDLEKSEQGIFSNYLSYGEFPIHRMGYDIGFYTVQEMLKNRSLKDMLNMSVIDIRSEFKCVFDLI